MKVISNTAISLDGRINTREGTFTLLGSARDHRRMSLLRSQADAVLVGGGTFRNWPHPPLPDDEHTFTPPLWSIVVTRGLDIPLSEAYLNEPRIRPLILTATDPDKDLGCEVVCGPGKELSIDWILGQAEARGIETLLVEAGGDLLFQFLAAGAIHEMYVTLCPLIIGGDTPSLVDGVGFLRDQTPRMHLIDAEVVESEIFLHYAIRTDSRSAAAG